MQTKNQKNWRISTETIIAWVNPFSSIHVDYDALHVGCCKVCIEAARQSLWLKSSHWILTGQGSNICTSSYSADACDLESKLEVVERLVDVDEGDNMIIWSYHHHNRAVWKSGGSWKVPIGDERGASWLSTICKRYTQHTCPFEVVTGIRVRRQRGGVRHQIINYRSWHYSPHNIRICCRSCMTHIIDTRSGRLRKSFNANIELKVLQICRSSKVDG